MAESARVGAPATSRTLSVVVPVYFNEGSIPELASELGQVEAGLAKIGVALQLVFVDDGSGDASLARLLDVKRARPQTTVVKLTRNFGSVQASKTGFRFVTGDAFLILAADLQDPPALIVEMAGRWLSGSKYVVAVRASRDDGPIARLMAATYYRLLGWVAVPGYPRGGYDMALMDKQLLPYMRDSAKNINTPLFAYWLGFKPDVMSYARQRRRHGRSRWTLRRRLKFFLDSILGFSIVPIRAISLIGFLTAVASLVYGTVVVASAVLGNRPVPGFATLVALVTFLISIVLLTLGVIAEYVWRIYDEVSRKPESVIDEIY